FCATNKGPVGPFSVQQRRLLHLHGAVLRQVGVPGEGLFQHVRGVAATGLGFLQVVDRLALVVRVHAVVDDAFGRFDRGQAAQVRVALLGDDHVQVMGVVVHVADDVHGRGDVAVLGGGGGHEDVDAGVAGEVARAANAVHHVGAAHVGGVHVAVDVHFQRGVEGD